LAKNLCEEDDIDLFYKSIAMTVKKMPPQAIKEAKLKTLGNPNVPFNICYPIFDFKNIPLSPSFPNDPTSIAINL